MAAKMFTPSTMAITCRKLRFWRVSINSVDVAKTIHGTPMAMAQYKSRPAIDIR